MQRQIFPLGEEGEGRGPIWQKYFDFFKVKNQFYQKHKKYVVNCHTKWEVTLCFSTLTSSLKYELK